MATNESLIRIEADLQAEALAYPAAAKALVVSNDRELEAANEYLKGNKALQRKIREWFKPHKTKARDALNGLLAEEKKHLDPLGEAEGIVKGKMAPYMEERERQRRAAEEAARKARQEAEAAARRVQEEAEAAVRAAEEERQRKAREALHDGELKKAEKILEEKAKEIVPVKVEDFLPDVPTIPEKTNLKGTHIRTTWGWELENIDIVPRILPGGMRPLKLDHSVITEYGMKYKDKAQIPGIRFFPKTGVASRGG